jgi:hypothetical protein
MIIPTLATETMRAEKAPPQLACGLKVEYHAGMKGLKYVYKFVKSVWFTINCDLKIRHWINDKTN